MCGICGIVNRDERDAVPEDLVLKMCERMTHRGPDEEGTFFDGNVGLGMRRLKVIDLVTGSQPIFDEKREKCIVFNGEIYNFKELRAELEAKGRRFQTTSDTEVVLRMYEEHDEEFLKYLDGMFGIAIYDWGKGKLILARDRLGEKPLYYSVNDRGIVFASEAKSVFCVPWVDCRIDPEALYYYFLMLCVPGSLCIYQDVKKLLPGHYLTFVEGRVEIKQYWDVHYEPEYDRSPDDFCEELRHLMKRSVKRRMISDVPLGAFLSGGIDSSIVVGLMSEVSDFPVKTFTIGFREEAYNETDYARIVAKRHGTEHNEFVVDADKAIGLAEKIAWYFDEPFGGPSAIPTFIVSELARKQVTVVITGDGGDEVFAGYDSYAAMWKRRRLERIPRWLRERIGALAATTLGDGVYGKRFLESLGMDPVSYFVGTLTESRMRNLFTDSFLEEIRGKTLRNYYERYLTREIEEDISLYQYLDTKCYLPGNVLVKVDRMSMANSLETRTVFLDHNIVELAARIPAELKIRQGETKYILKRAMGDLIPEAILKRGKWGFALPIGVWFRKDLRDVITRLVEEEREPRVFNYGFWRRILAEHMRGRRDHGKLLWSFLMYERWQENWGGRDG